MAQPILFKLQRPFHSLGFGPLIGAPAAYPPWTPRSVIVTPLVAWHDQSDITTLFKDAAGTTPVTADGDEVLCIKDKSGNGNHATGTAGTGPIYRTGGGAPYLEFDGTKFLVTGAIQLTGTGQHSAAVAAYFNAVASYQNVLDVDNLGANRLLQLRCNPSGQLEALAFDTTPTAFTDTGPSIPAVTGVVLSEIRSAAAIEAYVNGVGSGGSAATTGTPASPVTNLTIGAFDSGNSLFFIGKYFGSANFQGALSANDHAQLVAFLTAKMTATVSNEISGTSSLTFAPSATTTGLGTLAGSSTLTLTPSGTATGLGSVAGSSTLTLTPSGTATGLGSVAGTSSLLFSPNGTATGLGKLLGTTALTFAPAATATGLGGLIGSSTLVLTPAGTVSGLGSLIGGSAVTFAPAGTITGIGTLAATTALAFAGSGTITGIGTLAGSSAIAFATAATLTGLGSLLASTALSFSLAGTVGTGTSNDIVGSASLTFAGSAALSGTGQMAGSTSFSLAVAGELIAGAETAFVPDPKPANANLTPAVNPSETNVIGPARPGKVAVTTVSTGSGTFVPAVKPARGQWRT
jgi:hypothetical protein